MKNLTANTLIFCALLALSLAVFVQPGTAEPDTGIKGRYQPPEIDGMRHIQIGEDENKDKDKDTSDNAPGTNSSQNQGHTQTQQKNTPASQDKGTQNRQDKNARQNKATTKPESHFRPSADWQRLDVIPDLVSGDADNVNRALADVAAEPHKVTPYGLLLAARGHIGHDQMRQAALYYYAAQLRTRFDGLRFPANNPSALKHDRLFSQLAQQLSRPVYEWVFAEKGRFQAMKQSLREWALDTPYAYKPLYPVPEMREREKWPDLHKKAQDNTFAMLDKRAQAYRQHKE